MDVFSTCGTLTRPASSQFPGRHRPCRWAPNSSSATATCGPAAQNAATGTGRHRRLRQDMTKSLEPAALPFPAIPLPATEPTIMRITLVGSRHFGVTTLEMLRQHDVEVARVVVADADD